MLGFPPNFKFTKNKANVNAVAEVGEVTSVDGDASEGNSHDQQQVILDQIQKPMAKLSSSDRTASSTSSTGSNQVPIFSNMAGIVCISVNMSSRSNNDAFSSLKPQSAPWIIDTKACPHCL